MVRDEVSLMSDFDLCYIVKQSFRDALEKIVAHNPEEVEKISGVDALSGVWIGLEDFGSNCIYYARPILKRRDMELEEFLEHWGGYKKGNETFKLPTFWRGEFR